jgi:hypothetical protein
MCTCVRAVRACVRAAEARHLWPLRDRPADLEVQLLVLAEQAAKALARHQQERGLLALDGDGKKGSFPYEKGLLPPEVPGLQHGDV